MPLHPINRLSGLKPGQTWQVPLFDPVATSLAQVGGGEGRVTFLKATVRTHAEYITYRVETPCLVIDYRTATDLLAKGGDAVAGFSSTTLPVIAGHSIAINLPALLIVAAVTWLLIVLADISRTSPSRR